MSGHTYIHTYTHTYIHTHTHTHTTTTVTLAVRMRTEGHCEACAPRPQSGDLLVNKIAAKKKVQTRLNQLRARKYRLHSEHIDDNFRARDNKRFRSPRDRTPSGSRLQVNNNIITCPDDVMSAWVTHFETLSSSKVQESPLLQQLQ